MDLKKLSLGERILAGAGIALVIDLLFLPWHHIKVGVRGIALVEANRSGIESPNAFLGVLALLVAAALVAHVILSEYTSVKLPTLPVSWGRADLIGGVAVAAILLLKLVLETDFLGFGAWLGLVLGAAMAYGGVRRYQETEAAPGSHEARNTV